MRVQFLRSALIGATLIYVMHDAKKGIPEERFQVHPRGGRRPLVLELVASLILVSAMAWPLPAAGAEDGASGTMAEEPYVGPPISTQVSGKTHVVVVMTPSPGWSSQVDGVSSRGAVTQLRLTLRRPDPSAFYAQVLSTLRIESGVAATVPLEIWVRVLDFRADPKAAPYALAHRTTH